MGRCVMFGSVPAWAHNMLKSYMDLNCGMDLGHSLKSSPLLAALESYNMMLTLTLTS